jgi:hypothetical protein
MRAPKKNVISLKVVFGLWEMFACHAVKFKHICSNFDCHAADSQDGHRYLPVLVLFLFPVSQAWFPHATLLQFFPPSSRLCSVWICKSLQVHSSCTQPKLQVSIKKLEYHTDGNFAT